MSSILDISSIYNSYSSTLSSTSGTSLQSSLNSVSSETEDEELMEVCKDFEAYFVQKMIEEAKKTIDSEDDEGEYMKYFGDTLTQSYADAIADSGTIGLAQQLYDSLKQNNTL